MRRIILIPAITKKMSALFQHTFFKGSIQGIFFWVDVGPEVMPLTESLGVITIVLNHFNTGSLIIKAMAQSSVGVLTWYKQLCITVQND